MNSQIRNKFIISSVIATLVFGITGSALVSGSQTESQKKPATRKMANKNKKKQVMKKSPAVAAQQPKPAPVPVPAPKVAARSKGIPKTLRRIAKRPTVNRTRGVFSSRGTGRRPVPAPVIKTAAKPSSVSASFSGKASWYSFSRNHGMFAAMRGYRGKKVRVTGPRGTIIVTINDYGPQKYTGKIIDLSAEAFKACIGPLSKGVGNVKIEVLN